VAEKKARHLPYVAGALGIASIGWLLFISGAWVEPYLKDNWVRWFGVEWFQDVEWRSTSIFFSASILPMIVLMFAALWTVSRYYQLNFLQMHAANLKDLEKAREALQQGLVSLATIESEYKGKLQSYERLQTQLVELQAVKNIDTEDLRRKLNAIASASRASAWFERGLGFFMGVMSSLVASYVWARMYAT
jgi:hypothetical protein